MYEDRKVPKQIATAFALIGLSLVLLSGTRNATVASIIGIGVLWWVFRTRIFIYLIVLAMLGLLVQILLSGNESIEVVTSRLGSTENTRLGAWALYGQLSMESPIFGYGYAGLPKAVYGASLVDFVSRFVTVNVPGVHNYYLGLAVRFGIPAVILSCTIMFLAFRTAWLVVFNKYVPDKEKRAYIMPCAMLTLVTAEGLFEDPMGSTGKGSLHGVMFAISAFLMVVYGRRLLQDASKAEAGDKAKASSRKLVTI
jgi:O-antigen ligase